MVERMARVGIPQEMIASIIGVAPKTLRKHFREVLDLGATKANAEIANRLYEIGMEGNVTALIFWLKTRMAWNDKTSINLNVTRPVAELSDAELAAIIHRERGDRAEETASGEGQPDSIH